ncbi:MAG: M1 family metallopeptidase [Bacteroidales bacterium]|nr:M1 family metallopeptidase [Bacteroidales bacterium]
MKKLLISILMFLAISIFQENFAQNNSLYMPKNIKNAYDKDTRSFDGKPGNNYFQNTVDYTIDVDFVPQSRLLKGEEKIVYKNNSPDSLKTIVIRLYADFFRKGNKRNYNIGPDDIFDGVEITRLNYNGDSIDIQSDAVARRGTNLYVNLPEAIVPKSNVEFEIFWNFVYPGNTNIRTGRYNETSYFIGYWYPKISVYDDIDGWNRHVHNGEQEFYNEYGDFDVKVTVPKDNFVWSSGILQNASDVYSKTFLKKYEKSKNTDEIIHVVTADDIEKGGLLVDNEKNTWHFKATYLTDFAFALSDNYLWDATSVQIGNKRVIVNAVYFKESIDFHEVAEISKNTLKLLSEKVIGIDYPYPQMTAFNGHYGMEFPMMINDGDANTRNGTIFVTSHEITHSYFPFYVGTSEQKYAWMDEGLVTFLPKEIENNLSDEEGYNSYDQMIKTYSFYAGSSKDLPLMVPSDQTTGTTYRLHAYSRSATAFYVLRNILGKEMFQKCLKEFINRWNGKHPTGYDFFYTFNNVSGEDLFWFWQPWFFDFGYPDIAVKSVEQKDDKILIKIEKLGNFPTPVNLIVQYNDGTEDFIEENAKIWKDGKTNYVIDFKTKKEVKSVEINTNTVPDNNNKNNSCFVVPK